MPKIAKLSQIPKTLLAASAYSLNRYQKRSRILERKLSSIYQRAFNSIKISISARFEETFGNTRLTESDSLVWDVSLAKKFGLNDKLKDEYEVAMEKAQREAEKEIKQSLREGVEEGYNLAIWSLYQGGIDIENDPGVGDEEDVDELMQESEIDDVGYDERLGNASLIYLTKFTRMILLAEAANWTLSQLLEPFRIQSKQLENRILKLGSTELRLAYNSGYKEATVRYADSIDQEIWVSRGDAFVCPICSSLHLSKTKLQPISHSHPGCRCRKVPIPSNLDERSVGYEDFIKGLKTNA